jgi:hypothetical protein
MVKTTIPLNQVVAPNEQMEVDETQQMIEIG